MRRLAAVLQIGPLVSGSARWGDPIYFSAAFSIVFFFSFEVLLHTVPGMYNTRNNGAEHGCKEHSRVLDLARRLGFKVLLVFRWVKVAVRSHFTCWCRSVCFCNWCAGGIDWSSRGPDQTSLFSNNMRSQETAVWPCGLPLPTLKWR